MRALRLAGLGRSRHLRNKVRLRTSGAAFARAAILARSPRVAPKNSRVFPPKVLQLPPPSIAHTTNQPTNQPTFYPSYSVTMDEGFAGINPGRLQMIQDMDNAPPPRTLGAGSRGGRGGRGNGRGGRGRGRGGNRFQGGGQGGHGGRVGRRMVFGDGAPNMEEGNTATPEESESGLEIRNKAKRKRDAAEEGAINVGRN